MNLKRKALVIEQALDQWEKEIYWHHELLTRRRWTDLEVVEGRMESMREFIFNLMDEVLLGEDNFYQTVQESLL